MRVRSLMLKATQHNVGYSCQGSRLGAATNSYQWWFRGTVCKEMGMGVYGCKEFPQVIEGKVTQCSLGWDHK